MGRTKFRTLTIRSEPRVGKRKASTRAKWRSSPSARSRVLEKCLTPPTLLEMAIFRQLRITALLELACDRLLSATYSFANVAHDVFPFCLLDDVVVFGKVTNSLLNRFP